MSVEVLTTVKHCYRILLCSVNNPKTRFAFTEDDVYFDNTSLLKEYVLNDSGVIFHGNHKQIGAKPWFFGQVRYISIQILVH